MNQTQEDEGRMKAEGWRMNQTQEDEGRMKDEG
jgi:hypothetical protein